MSDELQAALARAEAAEAEVKRLEALELARANANARTERAERERAASDEAREMWFKKWCSADDERRNAERQRDEAFTAGAEAMREAIYNYVYDEAEAMKEQAYNLIEHHSFRPGGRGVSNEAKRKGFIRDRQQIAEKLFIDAAHIRALPTPAQEK